MTTERTKTSDRNSAKDLNKIENKHEVVSGSKQSKMEKSSVFEYNESQKNQTMSTCQDLQSVSNIADSTEFECKVEPDATKDVADVGLQVEIITANPMEEAGLDSETHVTEDIKHWCLYGQRVSATPGENPLRSIPSTSDSEVLESVIDPGETPCIREKQAVTTFTGQCPTCSRNFDFQRLEAHINICGKISGKKRCVFDSRRQRLKGTPSEYYIKRIERTMKEPAKLCSNWQQKRKEFTQRVRTDRTTRVRSHAQFAYISEDLPHP